VFQSFSGHFINGEVLVLRIKIVGFDGFNDLNALFRDESDVSLPFEGVKLDFGESCTQVVSSITEIDVDRLDLRTIQEQFECSRRFKFALVSYSFSLLNVYAEKPIIRVLCSQVIQVTRIAVGEVNDGELLSRAEKRLIVGLQVGELLWHVERMGLVEMNREFLLIRECL